MPVCLAVENGHDRWAAMRFSNFLARIPREFAMLFRAASLSGREVLGVSPHPIPLSGDPCDGVPLTLFPRCARGGVARGVAGVLLTLVAFGRLPLASAQPPASKGPPETKGGLSINEPGAFQGYSLLAPMNSQETFLIDMEGRVVNTWKSDFTPALALICWKTATCCGPVLYVIPVMAAQAPADGSRNSRGMVIWSGIFRTPPIAYILTTTSAHYPMAMY